MNLTNHLNPQVQQRVRATGVPLVRVERVVRDALTEDLADGVDVTTVATISDRHHSTMNIVARQAGVVCGLAFAEAVFAIVDTDVQVEYHAADGQLVEAGTLLLSARGVTRSLLSAERTALNIVGRLSGVATLTSRWVAQIAGTNARIRDTRKTTPGLRTLEKYAVRCGGGVNHRMSLTDAALIKDNHVAAAGSIGAAIDAVKQRYPNVPCEVEVDSFDELREARKHTDGLILLDNFSVDQVREAVHIVNGSNPLEVSGGLTLDTVRGYAETGVDFLAVGALTHSAPVLDVAGDLINIEVQ